jgi:hypothetical protein
MKGSVATQAPRDEEEKKRLPRAQFSRFLLLLTEETGTKTSTARRRLSEHREHAPREPTPVDLLKQAKARMHFLAEKGPGVEERRRELKEDSYLR